MRKMNDNSKKTDISSTQSASKNEKKAKPKGKNNIKNKIKPPSLFLYIIGVLFVVPYLRLKYRISIDKRAIRGMRGPALVLAPHVSNFDHLLTAMALMPHRVTYVVSEHFVTSPKLRPILRRLNVITKKMFYPDAQTVFNIIRAAKSGRIIVLFPEGRLTWYARSLRVTDGTAELARKLGIDIYIVTSDGAGLTFPKWAKSKRRGKIHIRTEKLMTGEEARSLSADELHKRIAAAIRHDDEAAMAGVRYRCRDTTLGLDGILYKCPACEREFTLETSGGHIRCSSCGLDAILDEYYRLSGAPFDTISDWYEWQRDKIDLDTSLECDARVGCVNSEGNMDKNAGVAKVKLDRHALYFDGCVFGENIAFSIPTEKLTAFPVTVGEEFDFYYNGRLFYIYPTPDGRAAIKWVSFLDRVTDESKGKL